jgi:hypothetical protein
MKKIRQLKRIVKKMSNSIETDSILYIDFLLKEKYFNFQIEDWYGHNIYKKGKSRKIILENLFKIYHQWNEKLNTINKPFYLAIWLCEPRLLKSEIVCAIDEKIAYYEKKAFINSEKVNKIDVHNYGNLSTEFEKFDWNRKIDLAYFFDGEKKFYKNRKITHIIENNNQKISFYSEGDVWIGKKK